MRHFSQGRFGQQARFLQQQFLQDGNLPFSDILSTGLIEQALTALQVGLVNCVYTPLVTLRVFLGQVLSADHSCRAAVARLIAYRVARKQCACSPETGAYCQARKRLPEEFFSQIARQTGRQLDAKAKSEWLWKNRRVHIFDGATVSMPDTYANQQAYPQPPQQKPGLGFPLMRIAVIFSLACGAVLDVGMCRYAGKGQSELALLRQLWSIFQPGSIMLADRLMCAWTELVMLKQRDVDCVCRFNSANRKTDFRRGKRLGKDDHIVTWFKPTKPRSIDRQTYNTLPESLTIRECRVPIAQPGFRVKVVVIATTLLDHIAYPPSELAALYRAQVECRTRFAVPETNHADGRAAVQDSRIGSQGTVDTYPGLQPDSHDHRSGSAQTPSGTTFAQLQGRHSNLGSVSACDRAARRTRRGAPLKPVPNLA